MSEAEFDRLLDAVQDVMGPDGQDDGLAPLPAIYRAPRRPAAANDNGREWPLIPFPDGWYASC